MQGACTYVVNSTNVKIPMTPLHLPCLTLTYPCVLYNATFKNVLLANGVHLDCRYPILARVPIVGKRLVQNVKASEIW